ncbi:MAG: twin-arginine translocation signal domain-containing protein, partial [Planctomycetota bacterium]
MKNSITRRQFLKAGTAAATVGLGSRNGLLPTLQGSEAEG